MKYAPSITNGQLTVNLQRHDREDKIFKYHIRGNKEYKCVMYFYINHATNSLHAAGKSLNKIFLFSLAIIVYMITGMYI